MREIHLINFQERNQETSFVEQLVNVCHLSRERKLNVIAPRIHSSWHLMLSFFWSKLNLQIQILNKYDFGTEFTCQFMNDVVVASLVLTCSQGRVRAQ